MIVFITLIICCLQYVCTFCIGSSKHQDKFLVCLNSIGNKALSDSNLKQQCEHRGTGTGGAEDAASSAPPVFFSVGNCKLL